MDHAPRPDDPTSPSSDPSEPRAVDVATVTTYDDGPLLLRGAFELRTQDGVRIEPGRATVALCRCGKSARKPFCDGTHKVTGFRASGVPGPA